MGAWLLMAAPLLGFLVWACCWLGYDHVREQCRGRVFHRLDRWFDQTMRVLHRHRPGPRSQLCLTCGAWWPCAVVRGSIENVGHGIPLAREWKAGVSE